MFQNILTPYLVVQQIKAKLWLSLGLEIQFALEVSNRFRCFKPHGNHLLLPSLANSMKAGRLPSSVITQSLRYYSPLRLLTGSAQISVALILSRCGHHRNKRDLPRFPKQLPSHPVPTTPENPSALFFSLARFGLRRRWQPSPLDHRVGTLIKSNEALWVPG